VHAVIVKLKFWNRSRHVGITHQCELTIVQNEPLSVHTRRSYRVVFARKELS
jgi:hypothetical protein